MKHGASVLLFVLAVTGAGPVQAQSELEARLREALRQATAQQRTLEDENAQLKALSSQQQSQLTQLQQQLDAAGRQAASADRSAELEKVYRTAVDEFNQRLQQERDQVVRSLDAMEKWKAAYGEAVSVVRSREAEREQLAGRLRAMAESETACRQKNEALFTVGNEILDRCQGMSWGELLAAREPFLGLKRVELENLAQDDADRLRDSRLLDDGPGATTEAPAPAEPEAAPAR